MSTPTLFAHQIHHKNIPSDGKYVLTPFNIFHDYLVVDCKDGRFFEEHNEMYCEIPVGREILQKYSHYIPHTKGIDVGNSYVDYEEIIDFESVFISGIDELGFMSKDRSDRPFIMYHKNGQFCMDVMERGTPQCMFEGLRGWHDLDLPENFEVLNQVRLNEKQLDFVMKGLTFFEKNGILPDTKETDKTCRGFSIREFEMENKAKCSMQESSTATSDCIWFGVTHPAIRVGDKFFEKEEDFANAAFCGEIENYSIPFKIKHCSLPSRIEISTYYAKPMLEVMNIILKRMKETQK